MPEYAGTVVEILDGASVKPVLVLTQGAQKLAVVDEHGRQSSVPPSIVVAGHALRATRDTFAAALATRKARVETAYADCDSALLWEALPAKGAELSGAALAETYYSKADSFQVTAVTLRLLEDGLRFKKNGTAFTPRTEAQVAELQEAERRRAEKAAFADAARAWLEREEYAPGTEDGALEQTLLPQLEDFLLRHKKTQAAELLAELGDSPRERAFEILLAHGKLPADADPLVLIAGIRKEFPKSVNEAAAALTAYEPTDRRLDLTGLETFTIDDAETAEVDDALSVEELPEGGARLGIHIADAAFFVHPGDVLDEEGLRRATSVYLPTSRIFVFPDRLGTDLASLNAGVVRPALSLLVEVGADDALKGWKIARSQIKVARRLDYDGADALLAAPDGSTVAAALARLARVAAARAAARLADGALVIVRPELKIKVTGDEVAIDVLDTGSPSRRVVQECMVLMNHLAAKVCAEAKLPVIYRTQDMPHDAKRSGKEIAYDPLAMADLFKGLKPARLSMEPRRHGGLGVDPYLQCTSPIRRYADLVMQRQLAAHAAGTALPYDRDHLWKVLAAAEETEREISGIERTAKRYWLLEYLRRGLGPRPLEACALKQLGGDRWLVELTAYAARGVLMGAGSVKAGDRIPVAPDLVDPKKDLLTLKRA